MRPERTDVREAEDRRLLHVALVVVELELHRGPDRRRVADRDVAQVKAGVELVEAPTGIPLHEPPPASGSFGGSGPFSSGMDGSPSGTSRFSEAAPAAVYPLGIEPGRYQEQAVTLSHQCLLRKRALSTEEVVVHQVPPAVAPQHGRQVADAKVRKRWRRDLPLAVRWTSCNGTPSAPD